MKQFTLFIAFALLIHFNAFSQDLITKNNGEKIECKILNQDSTTVFFTTNINGTSENSFISRSQVQSIEYNIRQSTEITIADCSSLGLGMGFDFGGLGANLLVYPSSRFGLFVGAGYAIAGLGLNGGIKYRFISKEKFRQVVPYITAMYGYNASVVVKGADSYNKFFYGPTFGFGFDLKTRPEKRGYWTIALFIPVRSSEVEQYMDDLENNHNVKFENKMIPIGFSFGYRIIIK